MRRGQVADITEESARLRIAGSVGTIHGLVNAAGIIRVAEIDAVTVTEWREMFAVNVEALFFLTQLLLPAMTRGGLDRQRGIDGGEGR